MRYVLFCVSNASSCFTCDICIPCVVSICACFSAMFCTHVRRVYDVCGCVLLTSRFFVCDRERSCVSRSAHVACALAFAQTSLSVFHAVHTFEWRVGVLSRRAPWF